MNTITTKDGIQIYFKDWGSGQPIVFSHGWPLSADDWDAQMLFSSSAAIASSRTTGAAMKIAPPRPAAAMTWIIMPPTWRRLRNISTSRARCMSATQPVAVKWCTTLRATGKSRVSKSGDDQRMMPPLMVKTAANPGGLLKEVFDGIQTQVAANRAQFYYDLPAGPFYGFNRPGAKDFSGRHLELVAPRG